MRKLFQNKKGFTLVELMVTLAASGIVIAACAALLGIGFHSFNSANSQFDSHGLAILVTNKIKAELQYNADNVTVLSSLPGTLDSSKCYLSIDSTTKCLKKSGTNPYTFLYAGSQKTYPNYNFSLTFTRTTDKTLSIDVTVQDKSSNKLYETKTDVIVNNQGTTTGAAAAISGTSGNTVRFTPVP